MTPTLQIQTALKRLERARAYLILMERAKFEYRGFKRDQMEFKTHGAVKIAAHYQRLANSRGELYMWLQDRYNNTVAESLIIAPHMIET